MVNFPVFIQNSFLLALKREFTGLSLHWIPTSRLAWSLYKCAALWRTVCGLSATGRPLGTIREEKGISSRFRGSCRAMT